MSRWRARARRVLHLAVAISLLAFCAIAVGADSGPSAGAAAKCRGAVATIVGTAGNDRLVGTRRADVIVPRGGNDVVRARGGNDKVCDSGGRDRLNLGSGKDQAGGGGGADVIVGGGGNDRLDGGNGNDRISGGAGKDRIGGGYGDDTLLGGAGNDNIAGGPGTDDCRGGPGRNTIRTCETPGTPGPGDLPPVAVADARTLNEDDGPQMIDVLGNDTDPDGGPRSIQSVTQPSHGAVVITGGGSALTYQPNPDYCNSPSLGTTDNFGYTLAPGSSTASVAVTVTCVNDAPVVSTTGTALRYHQGVGAIPVDGGLGVSDIDSANLSGATVAITGNFNLAEDSLAFTDQLGITGTYNSGTGVLTLTGVSSVADYRTALGSVTFESTNASPPASKAVEFKVDDGVADSTAATRNVEITFPNTAPAIGAGGTLNYTENDPPTPVHPALTVVDPESNSISGASASVTSNFQPGEDELAWADNNGADNIVLDAGSSTEQTIVLTGTDSDDNYEAALRAVTYFNSSDTPSTVSRTVTFSATDEFSFTGADTRTVDVTPADDPPVAVNDSATVLEDASATSVAVLTNDTDVDAGPKTIASATDPANGTVVLTGGSPGAHTGLTYQPDPNYCNDPPGTTPDTFTYSLNGGSTATVSITVTCVNDAPVADDETFNGNDSAHGNTTMVVNDPDDGAPSPTHPKTTVSGDILAGDTDVDGPGPLTVTPGTFATNDGGSVTIESDGDFTFNPAASTSCTDTSDFFDYTVEDSGSPEQTDTGRVTIAIAGCVWYVNNNAAGNSGTSLQPFDTLQQAETASGNNHTVFVFDGDNTSTGYGTGYQMNSGERLIGEHEGLVVDPDGGGGLTADTLHPANAGAHPTLTANNEDVVSLDDGNEVRGFVIQPQGTGGGIEGAVGDTGGGTIDDVQIIDTGTAGTQPGLELDSTTGTFNVSDLVVDNSAATGTSSGSMGVRLNGAGTVNFASAGTISITTNGAAGLDAATTNMGTGSVFDDITVTASGNGGVRLFNTTGTTTLGNGAGTDLNLTTTSGAPAAFLVSIGGTVSVPSGGTANISATGGPAVDVSGTSGASLDLDTVSSTNSASAGIALGGLGTGTFSATSGSIGSAAGTAFSVSGGSGSVTYPGNLNNGIGQTASITNRTGGSVSLSGQINDTNDTGGGISLSSNTGGSTTFSNATKTLNTGTGDALVMTGSDGHTLTLSGGGLDIDTTSGKGLEATTSGTLSVTGSGNTIDTGSGRALNVSNTDIADSDLTFQRIASNGASNGINLNTTGNTNGQLVVSGTSGSCTSAGTCTGGAIQNSTGTGISLTSVPGGVSLTRMFVNGSADDGIGGSNVSNGLTLDNATVTSNGNVANTGGVHGDHGVDFSDLTGTSTFTSSNISNNIDANVVVSNASGTLNLNVSGGTYSGASGGMGDAIFVEGTGTGSQNLNVQGPITFANNVGSHLQHGSDADNTTDSDVTINNATMTSPAGGGAVLGGGITIVHGGNTVGGSNVDAIVTNNNIQNSVIGAIVVGTTGSVVNQQIARVDATIQNNTIGTTGVAGSGSVQGNGIFIDSNGNSVVRTLITGNSVRQWTNRSGLALDVIDGDAEMSATVKNNVFTEPNAAFAGTTTRGMTIQLGTLQAGDSIDACLDIGDPSNGALKNQVFGTGESPQPDVRYLHEGSGSVVQLVGYGGSAAPAIADIANWFQPRNNLGGTPSVTGTASSAGTTTTGAASCPQPAP